MSLYFSAGSETAELSSADLKQGLSKAFQALGERRKVLAAAAGLHALPLARRAS